jgi:hypothetical protein
MAILTPVAPNVLRRILELKGYGLVADGKLNWVMWRSDAKPITLPKAGDLIAVEVMCNVLDEAAISDAEFLRLRFLAAQRVASV